jgi:hypothetical protein
MFYISPVLLFWPSQCKATHDVTKAYRLLDASSCPMANIIKALLSGRSHFTAFELASQFTEALSTSDTVTGSVPKRSNTDVHKQTVIVWSELRSTERAKEVCFVLKY